MNDGESHREPDWKKTSRELHPSEYESKIALLSRSENNAEGTMIDGKAALRLSLRAPKRRHVDYGDECQDWSPKVRRRTRTTFPEQYLSGQKRTALLPLVNLVGTDDDTGSLRLKSLKRKRDHRDFNVSMITNYLSKGGQSPADFEFIHRFTRVNQLLKPLKHKLDHGDLTVSVITKYLSIGDDFEADIEFIDNDRSFTEIKQLLRSLKHELDYGDLTLST